MKYSSVLKLIIYADSSLSLQSKGHQLIYNSLYNNKVMKKQTYPRVKYFKKCKLLAKNLTISQLITSGNHTDKENNNLWGNSKRKKSNKKLQLNWEMNLRKMNMRLTHLWSGIAIFTVSCTNNIRGPTMRDKDQILLSMKT